MAVKLSTTSRNLRRTRHELYRYHSVSTLTLWRLLRLLCVMSSIFDFIKRTVIVNTSFVLLTMLVLAVGEDDLRFLSKKWIMSC